jgi:hypothetical protein
MQVQLLNAPDDVEVGDEYKIRDEEDSYSERTYTRDLRKWKLPMEAFKI